ncbi:MAG: hypothetical protein AAFO76_00635 [Cyanobacteria bacterium J06607_15]
MYLNTYDRFLGSWWGSIIGQSLIYPPASSAAQHIFTQPWLLRRREVAEILLHQQLRLEDTDFDFANFNFEEQDAQFCINLEEQVSLAQCNSTTLALLPLIIFGAGDQSFPSETIAEHNLKLAKFLPMSLLNTDILLWCYLLTLVLNSKSKLAVDQLEINVVRVIQNHQLQASPLGNKLTIVTQAIAQGISLSSLREKLITKNNFQATAIALSWYCFATTPRDFNLSIQRAGLSSPSLAGLVTALTGTLSGAYNGMARISRTWRIETEQQQSKDREDYLFQQLFESWLGIYAVGGNHEAYSSKLDAIAPPRQMQPRPTLKIISQSPSYHQKFPS